MSSTVDMNTGAQELDISSLSFEQLNQVKTQLEKESQALTQQFQSLKVAEQRLLDSKATVGQLSTGSTGKQILVPLTSSLYIPGTIQDANKLLVDVGTGYYVEKSINKTKDYFDRRASMVNKNAASLQDLILQKRQSLETVFMVMQMRMKEIEDRRQGMPQTTGN